jgi:type IV pilus assembly protein PilM
MVVNIGAQTTDFSIIKSGVISFTRTLPTGGMSFTKVLAQDLALPPNQAEEYKKTYGLKEDQLEGKVARSLKPVFQVILEEIKRSIVFFQNKFPEEIVSTIILSGGSAKMPGIVESIVKEIGLETQVGNPWLRIERNPQKFLRIDEEGPMFVVAVGLAMRET